MEKYNHPMRRHEIIVKTTNSILMGIVAVVFALPMSWLFIAAFNDQATLSVTNVGFSTANFGKVVDWDTFGHPIINSLLLSVGTAFIVIAFSVLAAYPLARFQTRATSRTLNLILFASCLPITSLMVPVYGIFVQLGIIDSMFGTVLFMAASGLPMGIFMMRNFIASVPRGLEEAAWVDGDSRLGALWHIVIPLMLPSILVIFISEFAGTWGNFFVPFMLLMSPDKQPAAVSIYTFFGQHGTVAYGQLAAFSLLYSIPIIIIYVITESRMGNTSLLAGAVKG